MVYATKKMRFNGRCPHCSTSHPEMTKIYDRAADRNSFNITRNWTAYECSVCLGVIIAKGYKDRVRTEFLIDEFIPESKNAHKDIPDPARKYLQQALETKGQPDLSAMGAASSIDAMLKERGLKKGTLNEKIDKAVEKKILTQEMADWAHAIRLTANDPRHADDKNPHVDPTISLQMLEFAETLGHILFVLPLMIKKHLGDD